LTAFTDFWNSPGTSALFTSAIMPILMVVAVSPTSLPGAADPAAEAAWVPDAEAAAVGEVAADELLLAELHPPASRTAAARTVISPAKRVLPRVFRPVPPRPGPSLLGLTPAPSTTSLPVSFDPATPVRSQPTLIY